MTKEMVKVLNNARGIMVETPNGNAIDQVRVLRVDRAEDDDIILQKDIVSKVSLAELLGLKNLNDISFEHERLGDKDYITLYKGGEQIGCLVKYRMAGKPQKVKQRNLYNDLVGGISKDYTFRISGDRVCLGVDISDYGVIKRPKEFIEAMHHINDNTKYNVWDKNLNIVLAYVEQDNGIHAIFIDGYTGEWLAHVKDITDELTENNKGILHRYKEVYLEELKKTESMIEEKLNRGA